MRLGQKVYVKSRQKFGVVHQLDNNQPVKVKLDCGEVIDIINLGMLVFNKLKMLILLISKFFRK